MNAAEVITSIRTEMRDEYLQPHTRPWIFGYSAGKDSTALLHLGIEVILSIPPEQRLRPIIVTMGDTRVENPVMQAYADKMWAILKEYVPKVLPGVIFIRAEPKPEATFWTLLLGRGYRAPTRDFRWCTDKLKIRPKQVIFGQYPNGIVLIGTRRDESIHRKSAMIIRATEGRIRERAGGTAVFEPLEHLTTDDLWAFLLQTPPPWGGSHRDLVSLYRNATGECPVILSKDDAPSCGSQSARFGCWTCTVVKKDRSLQALADGDERLEPLLDFRERLREVSEDPRYRATRRRNGQPGSGPLTLEARRMLLDELLLVQKETGESLISDDEIEVIHTIWEKDGARVPLSHDELKRDTSLALPALLMLQSGRAHYLTKISFGDLVRVCSVPPELPLPEERYQRDASWKRGEEISQYILHNRDTYSLPPLTLCIDGYGFKDGFLTLPPESRIWIVDGQHRRAAIELALERDRTLVEEEIGVAIYPYESKDQLRQLFADLNSGKPIPRSVKLFMDRRGDADVLKAMEQEPFAGWIDPVNTTIKKRSSYLWTLSALEQTKGLGAIEWWKAALETLPGMRDVRRGKISTMVARQRYVWAHGVGLRALGELAEKVSPDKLALVVWDRKDGRWQGNACQNGKMVAANVAQTAAEILRQIEEASSFDVEW